MRFELISGKAFNDVLNNIGLVKNIVFTNKSGDFMDQENAIDLSEAKDRTIVGCYSRSTNTFFVTSSGIIVANPDCSHMFALSTLRRIVFDNFDTSNVISMSYMFAYCLRLEILDLTNFNTSNVTDMSGMFLGCYKLSAINVSKFDTSKVFNMRGMFGSCYNLVELNLSTFNTSNVINMSYMFAYCKRLLNLNLGKFNTGNIVNTDWMFSCCNGFIQLNVENINIKKNYEVSFI